MRASLSSEQWEWIQRLFDEVVDLAPAARAARLDEACRDDPALREEVESLLAAHIRADDVLQVLDQIGSAPPQPVAPRSSYTGRRIAQYEVLEQLGGGGMGVVYKALDTRLKRTVALKFLPPQWSQDTGAKQRFQHEAQAASALDHPNICTIYEIGETRDNRLFIAMAYYDGQTLKDKIKQGPLPLDEALDVAAQIAQGLAKAHTRDIVHRDVKPANIMITDDGVVKLLDFGLAKMADVQLTKTGTTMGTVAYVSPEQTKGEGVDRRADVWSLGVVLYEMLTGERPFKGDYDQAVIYSLLNENPVPITECNAALPDAVEHVVAMCLEKEPALRYENWGRLANAYYWAGQRNEARAAWHRMIELAEAQRAINPQDAGALGALAGVYAKLDGREQEARAMIERLLALKRLNRDALSGIARTYEILGERDLALQYFEQALALGATPSSMERSPWMDALREDPRYKKMTESYLEMRE